MRTSRRHLKGGLLSLLAVVALSIAGAAFGQVPTAGTADVDMSTEGQKAVARSLDAALEKADRIEDALKANDTTTARELVRKLKRDLIKIQILVEQLAQDGSTAQSARFLPGNPTSVDSPFAEVKVEIGKELLSSRDVWLGVIPVNAPSSIWLQGARVATSKAVRIVRLGLERVKTHEKFQVVILSCPKGTFAREKEVRVVDVERLGLEIIDTWTIERTK